MSNIENASDSEVFILKKDENDDFVDLMITCFSEGLERERVNVNEIAKIMKKINKPIFRLIMKIMKVKMFNYGIKIENKLVSALTLSIEKKTATIGNVMTHPDYRRRGFARKLFQRAMNDAEGFDLEKVTLDVHAQNHGAIKLYESEGFKKYYHVGKAEFNLSEKELHSDDNSVDLKEISKIDKDYFDELLDYCYTQEMLKERNRKKMAKDYIPSRFIKFLAGKVGGQKLFFYGLYSNKENQLKGYMNANTSKIEEGINLSSPLVKTHDIDFIISALPKIAELVDKESKYLRIKFSMHRKGLQNNLLKVGFEMKDESLYMRRKLKLQDKDKNE